MISSAALRGLPCERVPIGSRIFGCLDVNKLIGVFEGAGCIYIRRYKNFVVKLGFHQS